MAVTTSQITITTMEGWYSGDTAPSNPLIGDLWLDTTTNEIKKWDGTNWVKQADTQGPQGPKGDSIKSRDAYWIKSSTKPEPPDSETGDMKGWTKGSEPPESALAGILPSDKFWRIYKETYSNGESEYIKYSDVELIGSYEVLNGLVQFRKGVTTTENIDGQDVTVIDGGKILTGSIKADKMSIKDLSALKAKIGGFNIGENSIYSGTKNSINNTSKGIYLDSNGHLYFGDDKSYMRFFQSADDNKYKLQISADSLTFGSSESVERAIDNIEIGGRNLITNSKNLKNFKNESSSYISMIFTDTDVTVTGTKSLFGIYYDISVEGASYYTLSFNAANISGTCKCSVGGDDTSIWSGLRNYITLEAGRTEVTFKTNAATTVARIYFSCHSGSDSFRLWNVKLEKGNKATDWTPAPEDVDAGIANAQTAADEALKGTKENAAQMAQMVTDFNGDIKNLQDQIDGNITTWFYNVDPAMNLPPVTDWDTDKKKDAHLGDIYYNTVKGYAWRFMKSGNTYSWERITDTDVTKALADAAEAQDTADSKRRVFYSTPTVPYDAGDLWVQGSGGDILRCAQAKKSTGSYDRNDWVLASKYTDDSALTTWITGDFATTIQGLEEGLVDAKIETYYQTTDPSTGWLDTQKLEHEGDLWYNSTASVQKYYRWSGTKWEELTATPPQAVFDSIDNKATIYTGTTPPSNPSQGDLWLKGTNDPILTYVDNTWVKYDKYTDDTKAEKAITNADKAQTAATEAAKTADNYISADSTGIMVSENKGATKETPSNATKNNVLITDQDVQIRNGKKTVASYGNSVIIGKNKSDNIQIKDNGFSINHDGNEMFAVKQEDEENNYINEIMKATYEASTDTYSLESSYKTYYPNKLPILYVIYRSKPYGIVSRKETIQYGDTKLPCTVSITEEGKYLVQFKKTDWDKSWKDMDPEIEMDYYAAGGGAMVTIGTRIDHGLANDGSWSLTVGSAHTAGSRSIAVGENNVARDNSAAIGSMCYARNDAIAVGSYAIATNYSSAAIGDHVSTDHFNQLVVGQYNRQTPYGTQFVVGCGVDSETANSAAITASGDIRLKGTVYIGCEKDSTGGKSIIDLIYPVGSIYMSVNSADPGTLFGGTWERIKDTFLLSAGDTYAAGNTGGSADSVVVSHTHAQKAHSHGFANGDKVWTTASGSTEPGNQISGTGKYYAATAKKDYTWRTRTTSETPSIESTGESGVGKNMPPYLAVYVWKRIS